MARILEKLEEKKWDAFVEKHPYGNLNQMSKWGEFQAKAPGRGAYWIVVVEDDGEIVGGGLVVRQGLPRGMCWLYAARGPLLEKEMINEWVRGVRAIAKQEKSVFLRSDALSGVKFKGFREVQGGFQPQHTLIVDLSVSEAHILEQMKQKGRYNIRLAEKKGVTVEKFQHSMTNAKCLAAIEDFYRLLSETTKRDGFSGHGIDYYKNMLDVLGDSAKLYVAKYNGEVISAAIVTYFGKVATYYYGVSSNSHRNVMAPYLLHWEIMRQAKKKGYTSYDLFGIAPTGKEKGHIWEGVTAFKRKFGGSEVSYALPQELVFNRIWYFIYRVYKAIRR